MRHTSYRRSPSAPGVTGAPCDALAYDNRADRGAVPGDVRSKALTGSGHLLGSGPERATYRRLGRLVAHGRRYTLCASLPRATKRCGRVAASEGLLEPTKVLRFGGREMVHGAGGSIGGFRNQQLELAELPDYSEVDFEPAARGYVTYSLVLWGLMVGLPVVLLPAVAGAVVFSVQVGIAAGGAAALLAVALTVYGYLDARVFGWAVRDHDLVTRQGVVWRKTLVVPLVRIQHVELASGPLERAFGTARLQVYTAGSGGADLVIYGLEPERAERLRGHLRTRIDDGTPEASTVVREGSRD